MYNASLSFSYFALEIVIFYTEGPSANYLKMETELYTLQKLFQFHRADISYNIFWLCNWIHFKKYCNLQPEWKFKVFFSKTNFFQEFTEQSSGIEWEG